MTEVFPSLDGHGRPVLLIHQGGPYDGRFGVEIEPHEARTIARQLDAFATRHTPPKPAPPYLRLVVDNRYPTAS